MDLVIKTLTPLWTGGVDQTSDRLHETGLIGSLRWWYEALVRGLGGYACDPTSDQADSRCSFDNEAYQKARTSGKSEDEAIRAGLKKVCPVCYLFGTTGWARLFQLRAVDVPTTPLHFRTTISMNKGWLKRVFGGANQNIDSLNVPYGELHLQFIPRRYDAEYAKSQFALVLHLAAEYGGIGARLQHGFGQFIFPTELNNISLPEGIARLNEKLKKGFLRSNGPTIDTPFNFSNFASLTFKVPENELSAFTRENVHLGAQDKKGEKRYIPCAFDLRYKGSSDKWGLRQWLKQRGWKETSEPYELEELDVLLGPRSQWGRSHSQKQIQEELRTAGRVFFSMPYLQDGKYILKIWAFWSPELHHKLPDPKSLLSLIENYMQYAFQTQPVEMHLGPDILAQGGQR